MEDNSASEKKHGLGMSHFALSNISLPPYDHIRYFPGLVLIGYTGLEVAPSRIWRDSARITFSQVEKYRRAAQECGLRIIGLHSLFFDRPDLGLFLGADIRRKTLTFLGGLSQICSDLGGKTIVFGSPNARRRGGMPVEDADIETIGFFVDLLDMVKGHDTCFVIESLGGSETDYIESVVHALELTNKIKHPRLKCHIDAKAVTESSEVSLEIFQMISPLLVHFHVNEPGLGVLEDSTCVDHNHLGALLRQIEYGGYISLEQKMLDSSDILGPVEKSYRILEKYYSC